VARAKGPVKLLSGSHACYHVYPAAGDSYVAVGALEPKFWANLCKELGCEELIEKQFAAEQAEVIAVMADKFKAATAEEWFERIGTFDCCVTPIRKAVHDPAPHGRAPRLGEHNGELL
jgi:alpha-methylacyl-CoA racemase